jgi:hypothetical protein
MIYHKLQDEKDILKMSFESYYQSGSMIGGEVTVNPIIYMKNGSVIKDIAIGQENYTTWAYEKPTFTKGETVAECLQRHDVSIGDVEKITVGTFDTTGETDVVKEFTWTAETGWKLTREETV